ncbi:taxadien-5-alpha-ol o-acetyltransferase [Quercus suber]|uniref:Taxadien-5-alpha-ol o-acetyltransferase n=1 Tax=Quercus suber TaxID=58331 RepID=A0AAW0KSS8_QUESU
MQVKISHTALVSPTTPPFHEAHTLPLSHLDTDPNLHVTFRYLRTYLNTATSAAAVNDPFQVISAALSAALVHYYPLAATLRQNNLFCSIKNLTVPLIHATVDDTTLDSLNYLDDNPDSHFLEQLVPDPDQEERLVNPCVLQVTVFKCGGFTLGAAIHHSLCDGLGATQFFNVMAELARGATRISVEPVWDRTSLLGPRDPPRVEAPIHEFLSLEKGFSSYSEETGPVLTECFNVSDECLEKFKTALFERATDEYVRSFIDFQHLHYGEGITAGKGVSGFTDWRHLGHSTVDFGWGGPVTVLPLSRNLLGSVEPCFFLPYSSVSAGRKDGFKVLVNLRESAMPAFKEEMKGFGNHEFGLSRY